MAEPSPLARAAPAVAGRLDGVEAARGIAAVLVVLRHTTGVLSLPAAFGTLAFGGLFTFGRAGVDFFFVLSGFIIAYVHAGDIGRPAAFGRFWRKRLLRIYPPYWIATAILGAVLALSPTKGLTERDPLHVAMSLLLLPEAQEPVLGVGWSLRHEMLFYLMFATLLLSRRLGIAVLAGWAAMILAGTVYRSMTGLPLVPGAIGFLLLRFFNLQFFAGMGVAWLVLHRPIWRPRLWLLVGAAIFLATGMYESFGVAVRPEWPPLTMAYASGSGLALLGLASMDRQARWRVPRPLVALGSASYSIYLIHLTTLLLVEFGLRPIRHVLPVPHWVAFAICGGSAVAAGTVFSVVIEQPLLRFGRRGAGPRVAAPKAA